MTFNNIKLFLKNIDMEFFDSEKYLYEFLRDYTVKVSEMENSEPIKMISDELKKHDI